MRAIGYRLKVMRLLGEGLKARGDGYENSVVEEPRCFLLGELVELGRLVVLGALGILVC